MDFCEMLDQWRAHRRDQAIRRKASARRGWNSIAASAADRSARACVAYEGTKALQQRHWARWLCLCLALDEGILYQAMPHPDRGSAGQALPRKLKPSQKRKWQTADGEWRRAGAARQRRTDSGGGCRAYGRAYALHLRVSGGCDAGPAQGRQITYWSDRGAIRIHADACRCLESGMRRAATMPATSRLRVCDQGIAAGRSSRRCIRQRNTQGVPTCSQSIHDSRVLARSPAGVALTLRGGRVAADKIKGMPGEAAGLRKLSIAVAGEVRSWAARPLLFPGAPARLNQRIRIATFVAGEYQRLRRARI